MVASSMEASLLQVLLGLLLASALASASSVDLELGGRMCSDDFAAWQAKEFLSRFQRRSANHVQDWSRCTRPFWMDAIASMSPEGTKVLFDIGCNKGYTSAYMFNVFAPQAGVSTKDIPTAMKAIGLEPSCGTCKDCEEKSEGLGPALMKSPQYNVQVHAFEPSTVNYGRLQKMKSTLFKGQETAEQDGQRVSWILHNRAVADKPGTARFPTTCSTTKCSLAQGSNATTEVNVTTVDRVMLEQGINYIDVLKIDAEGYDPAVIRGAQRALREHKVGLLMYEYNDVGLWVNGDSLKGVTEFLGQLGYVCWLEGEQLTRLTGCWHDTLEFKMWSNVVCAWRRHPVFKVLNKRAFSRSGGSTARVSRAASHMRQHQH